MPPTGNRGSGALRKVRGLLLPATLRDGYRLLRPHLPESTGRRLVFLALIGVLTGLFEAAALSLVGVLAASLATGDADQAFDVAVIGSLSRGAILTIGLSAVVMTIVLRAIESAIVGDLGTQPLTRLREALVRGHLRAGPAQLRAERTGELQDLLMTHTVRAAFFLFFLAAAIPAAAMFVVLSLAAAVVYPLGFVLVVGAVALLAALTAPLQHIARRYGRLQADSTLVLASEASEAAASATEIWVFDAAEPVIDRLGVRIREVSRQVRIASTSTRFMPHLYRALVLALLLIGLAAASAAGVDDLAVAGTMVLLLIRALMASQLVNSYAQAATEYVPFIEDVINRLDHYEQNRATGGSDALGPVRTAELTDVWYAHADDPETSVLRGVSLRIDRGDYIGISGASGSGKSTLLSVLLGLLEPTAGLCRINGLPPSRYDSAALARQVAAVPQQPLLLTTTVTENIRFFRTDVNEEAVEQAARSVGLHDEIISWPDGYDTVIGERGARSLSGGQRQRIGIARALAGEPTLLVLDEPTSALDRTTENAVADALDRVRQNCAVVIVSHRHDTLGRCDRVVHLSAGHFD